MNKEQFQKHCEMQANWWIASALTGHVKTRDISDGSGRQLTNEEKTEFALQTAQNHIRLFRESCES